MPAEDNGGTTGRISPGVDDLTRLVAGRRGNLRPDRSLPRQDGCSPRMNLGAAGENDCESVGILRRRGGSAETANAQETSERSSEAHMASRHPSRWHSHSRTPRWPEDRSSDVPPLPAQLSPARCSALRPRRRAALNQLTADAARAMSIATKEQRSLLRRRGRSRHRQRLPSSPRNTWSESTFFAHGFDTRRADEIHHGEGERVRRRAGRASSQRVAESGALVRTWMGQRVRIPLSGLREALRPHCNHRWFPNHRPLLV